LAELGLAPAEPLSQFANGRTEFEGEAGGLVLGHGAGFGHTPIP
jgi:hypothetical protein